MHQFSALIDGRAARALDALLPRLHQAITELYASVLVLPDVDRSDAEYELRLSDEQRWALYVDLKSRLGRLDHLREIFDPYDGEDSAPVDGSLADALADIYRDVREAQQIADGGSLPDALWELRTGFEQHWGKHALDAMRALHMHRFYGSAYELPEES